MCVGVECVWEGGEHVCAYILCVVLLSDTIINNFIDSMYPHVDIQLHLNAKIIVIIHYDLRNSDINLYFFLKFTTD